MTVTWMESFDNYNSTNNPNSAGGGYSSYPSGNVYATGRFGVGQCLDVSNATIKYPVNGGSTTDQLSWGQAFKVASLNHEAVTLWSGGSIAGQLRINTSGAFEFWRGDFSALLGTSAAGLVNTLSWNYIEMEWVKSATVGVAKVYLNGVLVLNLTNVNTGTLAVDALSTYWPQEYWIDDLYVTNTSTRLGEIRIDTIRPTADTADKDWTPSAGTDNYAMVDEATFSTTDYLSSTTVGDKDYYALGDLSFEPANIYAVRLLTLAKKDDATTRTFRGNIKSSSSEANGTTRGLGTSYTFYGDIFPTDPNGSIAWTQASINSLQAGIEVVS